MSLLLDSRFSCRRVFSARCARRGLPCEPSVPNKRGRKRLSETIQNSHQSKQNTANKTKSPASKPRSESRNSTSMSPLDNLESGSIRTGAQPGPQFNTGSSDSFKSVSLLPFAASHQHRVFRPDDPHRNGQPQSAPLDSHRPLSHLQSHAANSSRPHHSPHSHHANSFRDRSLSHSACHLTISTASSMLSSSYGNTTSSVATASSNSALSSYSSAQFSQNSETQSACEIGAPNNNLSSIYSSDNSNSGSMQAHRMVRPPFHPHSQHQHHHHQPPGHSSFNSYSAPSLMSASASGFAHCSSTTSSLVSSASASAFASTCAQEIANRLSAMDAIQAMQNQQMDHYRANNPNHSAQFRANSHGQQTAVEPNANAKAGQSKGKGANAVKESDAETAETLAPLINLRTAGPGSGLGSNCISSPLRNQNPQPVVQSTLALASMQQNSAAPNSHQLMPPPAPHPPSQSQPTSHLLDLSAPSLAALHPHPGSVQQSRPLVSPALLHNSIAHLNPSLLIENSSLIPSFVPPGSSPIDALLLQEQHKVYAALVIEYQRRFIQSSLDAQAPMLASSSCADPRLQQLNEALGLGAGFAMGHQSIQSFELAQLRAEPVQPGRSYSAMALDSTSLSSTMSQLAVRNSSCSPLSSGENHFASLNPSSILNPDLLLHSAPLWCQVCLSHMESFLVAWRTQIVTGSTSHDLITLIRAHKLSVLAASKQRQEGELRWLAVQFEFF